MAREIYHLRARNVWSRLIGDLVGVPPTYLADIEQLDEAMDEVFAHLSAEEPRFTTMLSSPEMTEYIKGHHNALGAMLQKDLNMGLDIPSMQLRHAKLSFRLAAYVGFRGVMLEREGSLDVFG